MKTLVLSPRYTEDSTLLGKAAGQAGWAVERLPSWHIPSLLKDEDVCLYGEPLFVMHAAMELAIAMIETPYDWLAHQPEEYVRRIVRNTTMEDARAIARPSFIKPAMEKFFRAAVFESGSLLPGLDAVSDQVPVIVAEPIEWEIEFRCFVTNGRCETMSPYLIHGELARTEDGEWLCDASDEREAKAFLDTILHDARVALPPAIVLDIGRIRHRGWAIVEPNPAWGSGIYGCDPAKVLHAVARSCVRSASTSKDDFAWIIDHASEDFQ